MAPRADQERQFTDVARLMRRSRIGSVAERLVEGVGASLERSRILAAVRARLWSGTLREERVRVVAVIILSAAVCEAILIRFVPDGSAPALPPLLWFLVAAVAAIPATAPQVVVRAWDHWRRRY